MRTVLLTRGRLSAATAAVAGITSAVTVLALDPAPAGAASSQNWASGVTADGTVLNIPATPDVSSSGPLVAKNLATLTLPSTSNPQLTAGLLDVSAGTGAARASVADINIANQIKASLIEATCQNGAGDSKLVDASVAGQEIPVSAPPNTQIPPAGPITLVTINKQVPDGHGGTKVIALEVTLKLPGSPVSQTVDISTADCAAAPTSTPPSAPAPKPHQGTLPVTG